MPPFVMMTGFANLFGIGGASLVSRCLGAGDREKAKQAASFSIWGSILVSLVYSLVVFCIRPLLFPILGADAETYDFCTAYTLWTVAIGGVPTVLSATLSHLVRAEGYAKESSFGIAMGGVLNIVLDPLFIFPMNLGITGAAIATMLSNVAATVYFLALILKNKKHTVLKLHPRHFAVGNGIAKEVLLVGFPGFATLLMGTISNSLLNKLVASYSNQSVAGVGISKKVDLLAFAITNGLAQGVLPLIGYNYAAKNNKRLHAVLKTSFIACLASGLICTFVLYFGAVPLVRTFIQDEQTVSYGQHFLRTMSITSLALSVSTMIISVFQGLGQKTKPMILSLLRKGGLDIPFMYLMNHLGGVNGIPWATPIADCLSMAVAVWMFAPCWKELSKALRSGMDSSAAAE